MSIKRPSYDGADTDTGIPLHSVSPVNSSRDGSKPQIIDDSTKHGFANAEPESIPPPYEDEEGRKASVAVNTAEDLVTRVIDVEDDPTLNVWTFRMWFLGRSRQTALYSGSWDLLGSSAGASPILKNATLTILHRYRPIDLWRRPARDLLFQAADNLRLCGVLDRYRVCSR